jgi:hypothetical protein
MRSDLGSISDTMKTTDTSIAAWKMATINRPVNQNSYSTPTEVSRQTRCRVIVRFAACKDFKDQLKGLPVLQSMSRKDNGP